MPTNRRALELQIVNILIFAVTLIVNGLANTAILGGKTTAQISDAYPTFITPAAYVFAIWGIIYALLFVFVVFQALPSKRDKPFLQQIGFFFVERCFQRCVAFPLAIQFRRFVGCAHDGFVGFVGCDNLRLKVGKSAVSLREKVCVHLPFSVYLGWITFAAAADVGAALSAMSWVKRVSADAVWGVLAMAAVLVITLAVVALRKDVAYGLVIIWALAGIAVSQSAEQTIVLTAEIGAAITAIALAASVVFSKLKK